MESICTAETAEDAEIALTRLSANSAVSAVHPASVPAIHWKKRSEIFHHKIAHLITVVVGIVSLSTGHIEPKSFTLSNLDFHGSHAALPQSRLAIEERPVTVLQLTVDFITYLQLVKLALFDINV